MFFEIENPDVTPPGGWQFEVRPGLVKTHVVLRELVHDVSAYRHANGIPIGTDVYGEVMRANGERVAKIDMSWVKVIDGDPATVLAMRLGQELRNWARGGFKVLDQDSVNARINVCLTCGYFKGSKLFSVACGKCGCGGLKLHFATTKCPIDKWSAHT